MKSKLNIVYIYRYFRQPGRLSGMSSFLSELLKKLSKEADITVITERYKQAKKEEDVENYKIIKVDQPFIIKSALLARKIKPDFVIFVIALDNLLMYYPYFGLFKAIHHKKLILQQAVTLRKIPLRKQLIKHLPFLFKRIIATSPSITKQFSSILPDKTLYLPPGVDLEELERIKPVKKRKLRVGFFGHIIESKGPDILYNAFEELNPKNAELILAGTGGGYESTSKLREDIIKRSKNKTNIKIYGYLGNIKAYIKSCDIVVLPFRTSSFILGLSQTAIEAMAMKIPIIVSNTSCVAPLVKNNVNGFVFKNKEDLMKKLNRLLRDKKLRLRIGKEANKSIRENYDISQISKNLSKVLSRIK